MDTFKSFSTKIYEQNGQSFNDIALELFRFQAFHNPVYKSFVDHLSIDPNNIDKLEAIPFLPISFFKSHDIKTLSWDSRAVFTSSGTTGQATSKHLVYDYDFYLAHSKKCFEFFFSDLEQYNFLALLPSYIERQGSSLIAMMDSFIKKSKSPFSGFYLNDIPQLIKDLAHTKQDTRKTIVWGVSFALLDLAENFEVDLSHCKIFETGGMKGRRKEITRHALHSIMYNRFNVAEVFSEYGMTELFSQAYTLGKSIFHCPPWMKVIGRELTDPLHRGLLNETAGINVIDLANWHSVAFIETEDLGKIYKDGSFEVLGRIDNSEIRGCNLLVE